MWLGAGDENLVAQNQRAWYLISLYYDPNVYDHKNGPGKPLGWIALRLIASSSDIITVLWNLSRRSRRYIMGWIDQWMVRLVDFFFLSRRQASRRTFNYLSLIGPPTFPVASSSFFDGCFSIDTAKLLRLRVTTVPVTTSSNQNQIKTQFHCKPSPRSRFHAISCPSSNTSAVAADAPAAALSG